MNASPTPRGDPTAGRARADFASIDPCGSCEARLASICRAVSASDLPLLAGTAEEVSYVRGEVVVRQEDPTEHLFNLAAGTVRISKLLPDGRRQVIGFLFGGDFLGIAARDTYGVTAEAIEPTRMCRFPRGAFSSLLDAIPTLERELLARASNELAAAQNQAVLLGRKTAQERVATFLAGLAERANAGSDVVRLPMNRVDIADHLGLTTETVSRAFTRLRTTGVIEARDPHAVRIRDPVRLAALAAGG